MNTKGIVMRHAVRSMMLLAALASWSTLPTATAAPESPASASRLTVHVDRPGVKVSPTLYGIFFEEINCAGDGGLYAEQVRNRSFEDTDKPDHWSLRTTGSGKGEITIDRSKPLSEKNTRCLKLHIAQTDSGRVGISNAGYWGMNLRQNEAYDLSLYARCSDGFTAPINASLEGPDGKVLAEARIEGLTNQWKRFTASLTSNADTPAARLVLSTTGTGTIWFDVISLMPHQTWKGRPNGLRPDLAEMLNGLRPAFVRFPGGCWVEGDILAFATRWKRTIGDIADRWNQWNIWQYYSTNGLGFHEYLVMCEDLGAQPLFVINCGMSHRENVPMDKMGEWVQDALDAIEYANGPVESTWGALRVKAGHPAPFNLKYVEIGNENGGPAYQERYALFHDALRAKYPDLKLIANVPTDKRPADIIDEHYYSNPEFFIANAAKYDTYDRKGPRIYVGEYAVTANCGAGNLRGALGEAAFMTGMERNSDIVIMASYAPLFANVHYKKWNPDLINFDSSRVFGTPSYWVQKMFSEHRPDIILPTDLKAPTEAKVEPKRGGIGVGTWCTQAEFKDIRVTQGDRILFTSDLSKGADGWRHFRNGDWWAQNGTLRQTGPAEDCRAVAGDPQWSDITYSLKARKLSGAEGFLILFQVADDANWLWWNLGGWGNVRHGIERCDSGAKSPLGDSVPGQIETGRWYDIRIELKGLDIRCFLDGKQIHYVKHQPTHALYAVAGRSDAAGEIVIKVVNVSNTAQDARIDLAGVREVAPAATSILLTSSKPEDENTLAEPMKVSPKQQEIRIDGPSFAHTFPAHSLTVLRLKAKP